VRVTVNDGQCMGHTLCNAAGPDVYDLDDRGHCLPQGTEIPADLETQAKLGAEACPERAITVHT
jgi:ferredoxin